MGVSLGDAIDALLAGKKLSWNKYKDYKAGSIKLDAPEQRRLFEFLLSCDPSHVAEGSDTLFAGLTSAWKNDKHDPASGKAQTAPQNGQLSWRLDRIEAFGFGGLTQYAGKPFDLFIGGSNWCLEGQNGSGKTSLVSAILWALRGKRIRDHEGPIDDRGERQSVENAEGKTVGRWPPLAAYPHTAAELTNAAEVWVRLTFKAPTGEIATAYRRMHSPSMGDASMTVQIDDRLAAASRLADIGVLMPARITKIGFGKNSQSLFEAVKQLTGLDQLSQIADGSSAFGAANRKFLKYAKDQGIEKLEQRFNDTVTAAKRLAEEFEFQLPNPIELETKDIATSMQTAATSASAAAGEHLKILKSEIAETLNTDTIDGRQSVKTAVSAARGLVAQGPKAVPLFLVWKALTDAPSDENWAKLPSTLQAAKADLARALQWHARQLGDNKLRLKALAAQSFVQATDRDSDCPLCDSQLDDMPKRALAAELAELKSTAAAAEQRIADACRRIHESMTAMVPDFIRTSRGTLDKMDPVEAYYSAMLEAFVIHKPFSDVLTGIGTAVKAAVEAQRQKLPHFAYEKVSTPDGEPESATKVRQEIHMLERLIALADWWKGNRSSFVEAWGSLIGKKQEDGSFPAQSIEGKLAVLEQALAHARPLDDLSKQLSLAAQAATSWSTINVVQQVREAIAKAVAPLKELRLLVATETAGSIDRLSEKISAICERICLKESLTYARAVIERKEVSVTGSFSPDMRIDAALVANTSWLRAILWSFVLALREETLETLGFNPLPLVVLDDPQGTFDPRNKRKWAQELARCANKPDTDPLCAQLIVVTHERAFYRMLMHHEKLVAQEGLIGSVNKVSGVATIANGGELARLYNDAKFSNDDAKARDYIRKVRIHCEDLLKFMMRSLDKAIPDMTLNALRDELKTLNSGHVAPYDRKAFDLLINALNESVKAVRYINDPHHKDDETFGVAEADVVKDYWDKTLSDRIYAAFSVFDIFELYTGEPRTFPWAQNVVAFPEAHTIKVKSASMVQTGVAAAAKTNGRAGDGLLTVEEWTTGEKVVLPNHGVFQLAAGTLDPVAGVGDVIIVSNYAKIHPRNLVVAVSGSSLLARRYNRPENHSEIVVLTGQAVDPLSLREPVIVQPDTEFRKIVGTLFAAHLLPMPPLDFEKEFISLADSNFVDQTLRDARLFKVQGRSAEPLALEGQYLITRAKPLSADVIAALEGRLVIAIDEDGTRYFKRLRCHANLAVLESLNPDGTTASEIMSLDGSHGLPRLVAALEVVGVLFELPT